MTKNSKTGANPPQPELKYVRDPQFRSTYANNVAYVVSSIDFSLIFGQVLDGNRERVLIEQNAKITMTPIQAKVLSGLLQQQIAAFESIHGEIKIPTGMTGETRQIAVAELNPTIK